MLEQVLNQFHSDKTLIHERKTKLEIHFTDEMRKKFEIMYKCDKTRDASDKIRGFIFQDLVAIEFLLEEKVKYVFLEFLEDVDVAYEDGSFEIIQVKYYPKTEPDMKEITTDLYYQYLRFDLLNAESNENTEIKIKPLLVIHREETILKPDLPKMKAYIGAVLPEKPDLSTDIELQLESKKSIRKKDEQKKSVFSSWAYEESLSNFLEDFKIIKKGSIQQLQSDIECKLERKFYSYIPSDIQKHKGKILMGLAVIFIQKRYKENKTGFDDIKISKTDFDDYIRSHTTMVTDVTIVAYICAIATEEYKSIISENDALSFEQNRLLNIIYINTVEWLSEYCSDVNGQFCIVNTLSSDNKEQVQLFSEHGAPRRLLEIAGCKENLKNFFKYLWKIIFDICSGYEMSYLQKHKDLLKPQKYIVKSETKYICLHFPQDCVETSVILPPANGTFNSKKKNYWLRLMEEKPRKWFMQCDSKLAGKHEYDYSTAKIVENDLVLDLDRDAFIIECMQCVKIDENEWTTIDDCRNCIFAEKCVGGER